MRTTESDSAPSVYPRQIDGQTSTGVRRAKGDLSGVLKEQGARSLPSLQKFGATHQPWFRSAKVPITFRVLRPSQGSGVRRMHSPTWLEKLTVLTTLWMLRSLWTQTRWWDVYTYIDLVAEARQRKYGSLSADMTVCDVRLDAEAER